MPNNQKQTLLYSLLINRKCRIWRHLILFLGLIIFSLNQALVTCHDFPLTSIYHLYIYLLFILVSYAIIIYFNLYVLVPKYLLKKKYFLYITYTAISTIILTLIHSASEYIIRPDLTKSVSYYSFEIVSSFLTNLICFAGISISVFLKHWIIYSQRVNNMEKEKMHSEVEQLKEQINPVFLFNILNRTGVLAKSESQKSSDMLMKLSQLLRYQLYDYDREKVLLKSEIIFLTNFLSLEQLYANRFDFSIDTKGNINMIFIPPLLFLPFIQIAVNSIDEGKQKGLIAVCISVEENEISLACNISNNNSINILAPELSRVKQRLNLLFNKNYALSILNNQEANTSIINLQLMISTANNV